MRGPISRLIHPRSTPGMAWRCPAERVGSGGGLPGGRLVRAVGEGPHRRRTNRLGREASIPRPVKYRRGGSGARFYQLASYAPLQFQGSPNTC